ncbi:MAG: E3 ubiquitin ligase family protein, partial [Actinobacteria bacterium]|nr:E3 ubiquitin ligase family protein [Actinomycetota bacterium]
PLSRTPHQQELSKALEYVAERLGERGSFKQTTEVKGIVKCDSPLHSEIAREPCVYYSMTVTREYEESYWETNSQTKQQVRRTRRGSETVSNNSQRIPFYVEDATGSTRVNPEGAEIGPIQVVDKFESSTGGVITLGGFSIDVGSLVGQMLSDARTLGYRFRESILPLGRQIYILGEAADSSGTLQIQKPSGKGKFIISLKSEEELIKSTKSAIQWLLVGSIVSGVAGVGLSLAGLLSH